MFALSTIILLPLLGSLINGSFALRASQSKRAPSENLVSLIGTAMPFMAFLLALKFTVPIFNFEQEALHQHVFDWVVAGQFHISASLLLDRLSSILLLVITGIGTLIHLYSKAYMKGDFSFARYYSYLNLFLASMLILVLADNLLLMFVGWEGVGLCSYLLIGFWFEDPEKAAAGKKAFVVNRIGDFGFLLGIFLIVSALWDGMGSGKDILSYAYLSEHASLLSASASLITLALFIGATGKSAQIPLYVWLPDAMAGPTPVSALIHAATMVTAGVYMMCRLSFIFNYEMAADTMQVIAIVGALTAFFAASMGLVQNDIKKVLAYSTVSQLGYMVMGVGVGAYSAAVFHLMTHAFFKACLFLGAGAVIYGLHHLQDIRKMGGIKKYFPVVFVTFTLASLAIAGIPPFSGFFSKDEILFYTYLKGPRWIYVLGFLAAGMTAFYMFRLLVLTFLGKERLSQETKSHIHTIPWVIKIPLIILASLSVIGGFVGIPEALGGHNHFHHFLEYLSQGGIPHSEEIHHLEKRLAIQSSLWAVFWVLSACLLYLKYPHIPEKIAKKCNVLYKLLLNKYYIDEIYNVIVVQPLKYISDYGLYRFFDRIVIDTLLVKGLAETTRFFGGLVNRFQSGLINQYALYFFIAVIGLLVWVVYK